MIATHLLAKLSPEQINRLGQLALDHPQEKARRRAYALLLLDHGHSVVAVARQLGVARRSIYNWLKRVRFSGIESVDDLPRSGRPAHTTFAYRDRLEFLLTRDPYEFRDAFPTTPHSGWTAKRLSQHLEADTGIAISPGHLRALLKQWGYVYGRGKSFVSHPASSRISCCLRDWNQPVVRWREKEEVILTSWSKRRWKPQRIEADAQEEEAPVEPDDESSTPSMPTDWYWNRVEAISPSVAVDDPKTPVIDDSLARAAEMMERWSQ